MGITKPLLNLYNDNDANIIRLDAAAVFREAVCVSAHLPGAYKGCDLPGGTDKLSAGPHNCGMSDIYLHPLAFKVQKPSYFASKPVYVDVDTLFQ